VRERDAAAKIKLREKKHTDAEIQTGEIGERTAVSQHLVRGDAQKVWNQMSEFVLL